MLVFVDASKLIDFPFLSLHGQSDLTSRGKKSSRAGSKAGSKAGSFARMPRTRREKPMSREERKATMLQAMLLVQAAFMARPKGILIIHCEHGLHRSPAYFMAANAWLKAQQVTLHDYNKAGNNGFMFASTSLNKARLRQAASSVLWQSLGNKKQNPEPDDFCPYPSIMRMGVDVAHDVFGTLTPAQSAPQRMAIASRRMRRILRGPM